LHWRRVVIDALADLLEMERRSRRAERLHHMERAAGPVAGIFGPGSVIWTVDREAAVFLGAGRALLLQLAHPWVATAIADHSSALTDPIGRFHRTFDVVFTMVFGSLENALQEARRLHRRHSAITGSLPDELTVGNADHAYFANELTALMWVHATLVDTALKTYELVMPPLSPEMRDQYFDECRLVGALFGIPLQVQPPNWPAFTRWFDETMTSDRLTVGPAAERIGRTILKGAGRIPVPRWYSDLTASLLPESLRNAFGLRFGPDEKRRAECALRFFRVIYPRLNRRFRHVGPYQEALARISGRSRPDPLTRCLNHLWIGRSSIQK
jgi:uncharacterized protein (DUF2236 family)